MNNHIAVSPVELQPSSSSSPRHHTGPLPDSPTHRPQSPPPRAPSPQPTHTFHPTLIPIPTPAFFDSLAGGAHYSGVDPVKERHLSIHRATSKTGGRPADPNRRLSTQLVPANHQAVLDDLKELYECRPTKLIMTKRWRKNATFDDPAARCKGLSEIAPQWYSLPRLISKSHIVARRVLQSSQSPNHLIFWQRHEYVVRFTGHKKIVESVITVDLDEDEKIIRMVDQWDGKAPPTRWGASYLRRLNGRVVPWVPWLGSSPKQKDSNRNQH
ncbi:hypothetical protein BV25DRAFT_1806527 [Artomyces pyxidatus]|uniref:Uncharacterized protein n=1 Tax=Artomyces pyxidatus TaxID=48021 RepID=A0ACB8SXD3_9AGAM|nr:hypothetical protein BV25DRAFT_1806527 [Artomyces pyxidatus]